ncbi:hypothetical protein NDU88_002143 [Pleurodeles waltl]|uniref:Uncharacterized protein n=1 Tax=Pleurodeles waltl TaxID=8319 RepID=A0AAV7LDF6_PLEWA|nr:hypothetical protein NDU88_002143 [Pleurodeles waltl]
MPEEGSASGASLPLPAALEALGLPRREAAKELLVAGSCGCHFLCREGRDSALGPGQRARPELTKHAHTGTTLFHLTLTEDPGPGVGCWPEVGVGVWTQRREIPDRLSKISPGGLPGEP